MSNWSAEEDIDSEAESVYEYTDAQEDIWEREDSVSEHDAQEDSDHMDTDVSELHVQVAIDSEVEHASERLSDVHDSTDVEEQNA